MVTVKSDENGNIDVNDIRAKAEKHSDSLAAMMITYLSTYGVFEEGVKDIIDIVHSHGGQVYGWCKYECTSWLVLTWRDRS